MCLFDHQQHQHQSRAHTPSLFTQSTHYVGKKEGERICHNSALWKISAFACPFSCRNSSHRLRPTVAMSHDGHISGKTEVWKADSFQAIKHSPWPCPAWCWWWQWQWIGSHSPMAQSSHHHHQLHCFVCLSDMSCTITINLNYKILPSINRTHAHMRGSEEEEKDEGTVCDS